MYREEKTPIANIDASSFPSRDNSSASDASGNISTLPWTLGQVTNFFDVMRNLKL